MRIEWDTLSIAEWYAVYNNLPKTNLVQSYAYARAMRQTHFQMTRFGAIKNNGGDVMGLVQMQHVSFLGFKRIFIDRGPLWLNPDNFNHQRLFWKQIAKQFPKRFGLKRRFMPELEKSEYAKNLFDQIGFEKTADGYQTIWLDMMPPIKELKENLNKKWRNILKRSLETPLKIELDENSDDLEKLLLNYTKDRYAKQYAGASPKFIRAMEKFKTPLERSFIINGIDKNGDTIAMMYFWIHGHSATYQIGWNAETGRNLRAHYAMIWKAIEYLKSKNISYLDLGGINPDIAEGVTRFKRGLGGNNIETAGIYA